MTEAIAAGIAGQNRVLADNTAWKNACAEAVRALPADFEGTFEDLRVRITPACGEPTHHNAWGALAGSLKREGLLMDTGKHGHMSTSKSHGRKTPILRRA